MRPSSKATTFLWVAPLILALGWLIWFNRAQVGRIEYVSALAGGDQVAADPDSPTGYKGGLRVLIVPEHNPASMQWIVQTQQMLATGDWRLRHVDYDNAPIGREVFSPSPFRWLLAAIARLERSISGRSTGQSVERAALYTGPAVQLLLLVATALYTARRFGPASAFCSTAILALAFPLGGSFLPGQPEDRTLALACALWSVLPLAGSLVREAPDGRSLRRSFFLAGCTGGLGLWISIPSQVPVIIGIALAGTIVAWKERRVGTRRDSTHIQSGDWWAWALGGSLVSAAAYLIEYFPGHLWALRMEENHPAYAVAWLGAGALLARAARRREAAADADAPDNSAGKRRKLVFTILEAGAVLLVPALIIATHSRGFLPFDPQLTSLPSGMIAEDLFAWIAGAGISAAIAATMLPILILGFAGWSLVRKNISEKVRLAIVLTTGPALVALVVACFQLRWWNHFEIGLAAVAAAGAASRGRSTGISALQWAWMVVVLFCVAPGTTLLISHAKQDARRILTPEDVESLIERDLAHWMARRAGPGGANVLAPPRTTTSMIFHGGQRGLGTPFRENKAGFAAAVRIAGATSADEGKALAESRELTHIVMPSWDPFLEEYARLGANEPENSMIAMLRRWLPPRWLRPVPYQLPNVAGFEKDYVAIFEVVDVQDNALALSRLAEYFVEMGQLEPASALSETLERSFPGDLGALIARARVAIAKRDQKAFTAALDAIRPQVEKGATGDLPWETRVSLAIVLAQANQREAARAEVEFCLDEADEDLLRALPTVSLFRLLALAKAAGVKFPDPEIENSAIELLPVEMRSQL